MQTLLQIIHVLTCLLLILAILLQAGRSGGLGAGLSQAGGQIFGGRGASVFLTRLTSTLAAGFFMTSLCLSMLSSHHSSVLKGSLPEPALLPANPDDDSIDDTPDEAQDDDDDDDDELGNTDDSQAPADHNQPGANDPQADTAATTSPEPQP